MSLAFNEQREEKSKYLGSETSLHLLLETSNAVVCVLCSLNSFIDSQPFILCCRSSVLRKKMPYWSELVHIALCEDKFP